METLFDVYSNPEKLLTVFVDIMDTTPKTAYLSLLIQVLSFLPPCQIFLAGFFTNSNLVLFHTFLLLIFFVCYCRLLLLLPNLTNSNIWYIPILHNFSSKVLQRFLFAANYLLILPGYQTVEAGNSCWGKTLSLRLLRNDGKRGIFGWVVFRYVRESPIPFKGRKTIFRSCEIIRVSLHADSVLTVFCWTFHKLSRSWFRQADFEPLWTIHSEVFVCTAEHALHFEFIALLQDYRRLQETIQETIWKLGWKQECFSTTFTNYDQLKISIR